MLHPDWLEGTWVTWGWGLSVRCILVRSAGSCKQKGMGEKAGKRKKKKRSYKSGLHAKLSIKFLLHIWIFTWNLRRIVRKCGFRWSLPSHTCDLMALMRNDASPAEQRSGPLQLIDTHQQNEEPTRWQRHNASHSPNPSPHPAIQDEEWNSKMEKFVLKVRNAKDC